MKSNWLNGTGLAQGGKVLLTPHQLQELVGCQCNDAKLIRPTIIRLVVRVVSVQTPPALGMALEAQTTDFLTPSPLAGEGWGEGG